MKEIVIAIISSGLFSGGMAALISLISNMRTRKEMQEFSKNYNAKQLQEGLKLL